MNAIGRKVVRGCLWVAFASGALSAWPQDVELVSGGSARAEIVVSETPASVVRFAALELQAHVRAMTGVELPIVADGARTGAYPIFIGGGTSATQDFDFGRLPEQGYVVDVGETRTALVGRDSARSNDVSVVYGENPGVIVSAKGLPGVWDSVWEVRGSLDAVYGFLHAKCGVDWLDCTEAGTSCPKRKVLSVKTGRTVDSPFVRCRDVTIDPEEWDESRDAAGLLCYRKTAWPLAFAESKDERAAQARVKLAKDIFALRLRVGGERIHCNHSFYWCFDRFYDKTNPRFIAYHPEWFSKHLKKEKKGMAEDGEIFSAFDTTRRPAQMCYSNEDFVRQTIKDVRAYFDVGGYTNRYTNQGRVCDIRHPFPTWGKDVYSLEPMDNNAFCECPDCRAQYRPERKADRAECSDYWFGFVNKVAREIKKSHPGKQLSTLAYGPRREGLPSFPVEDNVVVHFCWDSNRGPNREPLMTKQMDLMRKWRAAYPERPLGLWLYGGFPHESGTWSKYIPPPGFFGALFDREMKFVRDLNIRECIFNCGLKDDFELFLGGRLMWNPSEDYETLKTEYFRGFGPAERAMRRFYEIIEERICTREHYGDATGHMNRDLAYGKLLTDEVFDRLAKAIAEADASVARSGTDWQRARVRNWHVGYWDYLMGARYKRLGEFPAPAPGVRLSCTECYSTGPIPLDGTDVLAGLPFSAKGSGGGFLWGLDPKSGDTPAAYRAMTTEPGFQGFWNGSSPTQLVYRCDVRIGKLVRFRIVTKEFARSRMFFNLVGWRKGRKVTLLEGVDFPHMFFGQGCAVWDVDFDGDAAPKGLEAVGIEERHWEKKDYKCAPRYVRVQAVDGGARAK